MVEVPRSVDVRSRVVLAAVELFGERGFEATSVDDLARAAGLSRSTYFRQVGGKEDAVFADHAPLLEELAAWMDAPQVAGPPSAAPAPAGATDSATPADPWTTVCQASERVFAHLSEDLDLARRRYRLVRDVKALRDREIITERQYEVLFAGYLRRTVPGLEPVDAIGFAALVTATHNHFLRQAVRSEDPDLDAAATVRSAEDLHRALGTVRARFGVGDVPRDAPRPGPDADRAPEAAAAPSGEPAAQSGVQSTGQPAGQPAVQPAASSGHQVLVASFPSTVPSGEVLRRIQAILQDETQSH